MTCAGAVLGVWYDRESLPMRRLTFHQEIEDGIRTEVGRLNYVGRLKATGIVRYAFAQT